MLEDRYYMRGPGYNRRSATFVLLIVNVVAFILQLAAERWFNIPVTAYLALSSEGLRHGMLWQLISFQFLHGGWLHLLLNCWAIYVFGRELEETLGVRRYLALYFSSGVAGGLLQGIAGLLIGGVFAAPVVGASAGVFGLIAGYASLHPDRQLTLLLFFIIPVSMRSKYLLLFSGLIAVLGIMFPGRDNVAHTAHLGGMIMGLIFVRYCLNWQWRLPRMRTRPRPQKLVKVLHDPGISARPKAKQLEPEEFLSKEVDPILDKISAHGIQSLTERERQILEAARRRIGRS